jgi:hypothetical protein
MAENPFRRGQLARSPAGPRLAKPTVHQSEKPQTYRMSYRKKSNPHRTRTDDGSSMGSAMRRTLYQYGQEIKAGWAMQAAMEEMIRNCGLK